MKSQDEIFSEFFEAVYGRTPNRKELTHLENKIKGNFSNMLFDSSWEVKMRESRQGDNTRAKIADFVKKASPQPASLGPPLPEYFNLKWPGKISDLLLKFEEATATDVKIKDMVIKKIRG
jgi:hypothetical protein